MDFNGAGTRVTSVIERPAASRATEWTSRVLLGSALNVILFGLFMLSSKLVGQSLSRVAQRPPGLPFTAIGPPAIHPQLHEQPEGNHVRHPTESSPPTAAASDPVAVSVSVAVPGYGRRPGLRFRSRTCPPGFRPLFSNPGLRGRFEDSAESRGTARPRSGILRNGAVLGRTAR